jgi:hypothetical protein
LTPLRDIEVIGDMILARLPFASAIARGALFGVGANGAGTARAHQIGETEGAVAGRSRARGSIRSPIAIVGRPIHQPNTFLSKDSTSAIGTFETCRRTLRMSDVGGRPEVIDTPQNDVIDPERTWRHGLLGANSP